MPAISLALLLTGLLARITRSTMLEVLRQDYIRTASAKGLPRRQVVIKHALSNALIPIMTVIGIIISLLLSGAVVTETLFSIPGIGQLLTQAVLNRDYPMVQGGVLVVTALLVLVNIAVDVLLRGAGSARALRCRLIPLLALPFVEEAEPARRHPAALAAQRLLHHRLFMSGLVLFGIIALAALLAPVIAPVTRTSWP